MAPRPKSQAAESAAAKKAAAATKVAAAAAPKEKAASTAKLTVAGKESSSAKAGKKPRSPVRQSTAGTYSNYLYKVLKQVHPELGVSRRGMIVMDSLVKDVIDRLAQEAGSVARYSKKDTMSTSHVQAATRLVLRGELAKHAVSEGTKATVKYAQSVHQETSA